MLIPNKNGRIETITGAKNKKATAKTTKIKPVTKPSPQLPVCFFIL